MVRRDKNIVKCNVSCTRGRRVRGLDLFGLNARTTFNHKDAKASLICAASNCEVISEGSIGDPLLSVRNPSIKLGGRYPVD